MPALLEIRDLEVSYGDRVALAGLDLALAPGELLGVIGPNGSGKSTLLGAIAGVVPRTHGGIDRADTRPPALVLQSTDVDQSLPITVRETVQLGRYPSVGLLGRFSAEDRRAVDDAMELLEVADLASRQLNQLSGGQRQRVIVAQGLAQEADLLLLDEPVTGLDMVSRNVILRVIDGERKRGRGVIMTTHELSEAKRCDQVLVLDNRPIACGPPATVLTPETLRLAFGGRFIEVGDALLLDDPHHSH